MRGLEFFGRYRQLVEELSNEKTSGDDWSHKLRAILHQLDLDSAQLGDSSAKLLYLELRSQFEEEAYLTDNDRRRKVLMAATKLLEFQRSTMI